MHATHEEEATSEQDTTCRWYVCIRVNLPFVSFNCTMYLFTTRKQYIRMIYSSCGTGAAVVGCPKINQSNWYDRLWHCYKWDALGIILVCLPVNNVDGCINNVVNLGFQIWKYCYSTVDWTNKDNKIKKITTFSLDWNFNYVNQFHSNVLLDKSVSKVGNYFYLEKLILILFRDQNYVK